MIAVILAALSTASVPTPGAALLAQKTGPLLLAQSDADNDEIDALEADMDRTRGKLGHDDEPVAGDATDEGERLEEDMDRARRHLGTDEPDGDAFYYDDIEEPPPPRRRSRRRTRGPELLIDGHGKTYYMVWGIVDWAIAAQMWAGGAVGMMLSALLLFTADDIADDPGFNDRRFDNRRGQDADVLRILGAVYGVIGVGVAIAGIFVANRASNNIEAYRQLKAGRVNGPPRYDPHRAEPE